jgi:hypothetical protein
MIPSQLCAWMRWVSVTVRRRRRINVFFMVIFLVRVMGLGGVVETGIQDN